MQCYAVEHVFVLRIMVQNHNTLQRLKVIFVKLTTAVAIEEKVNLQCKHATLVINYRR